MFASLIKDQMRNEGPPSEWCQRLLRSGCSTSGVEPGLSREEEMHIPSPLTKKKLAAFAPSAREIVHRAHEMRAALMRDAAWDPNGLLALPFDVVEGLSGAFERRGCRGLGIAEAMCLPFLLYSTDTVHIIRMSRAMRGLSQAHGLHSADAARAWLGDYAGVICALVAAGGLLRRYVNPSRLLPVLSLQTKDFLDDHHLVFRGLWMHRDFDVDELCRCYNLTSWSLWARGAFSVLRVYKGRVEDAQANVPVLLVALRSNVMKLALPTTALYFAASPDGKEAGREDRPRECLPKSRLRPVRNDSGVAQGEKEIVLPPFCHLAPFGNIGALKLADLRGTGILAKAGQEWQLNARDADWLHWELCNAWHDGVKGGKALSKRDVDRCAVVFISEVTGTWFDEQEKV